LFYQSILIIFFIFSLILIIERFEHSRKGSRTLTNLSNNTNKFENRVEEVPMSEEYVVVSVFEENETLEVDSSTLFDQHDSFDFEVVRVGPTPTRRTPQFVRKRCKDYVPSYPHPTGGSRCLYYRVCSEYHFKRDRCFGHFVRRTCRCTRCTTREGCSEWVPKEQLALLHVCDTCRYSRWYGDTGCPQCVRLRTSRTIK